MAFRRITRRLVPATWLRLPRRTARLRLTLLYGGLFLLSGVALLAITNILARTTGLFSYVPSGCNGPNRFCDTVVNRRGLSHLPASAAAIRAADLDRLLVLSVIALAVTTVLSMVMGWIAAGQVLRRLQTITDAARAISASNLDQRLALTGPDDELKQLGDTLDGLFGRLEAAFEAQRHFVANASHELRTPLALERTLLQVALADPQAPAGALRSTCEELLTVGMQQQRLIEALLTLARSETGLDSREPFDLAEVTAEALAAARPEMDSSGLAARTSISPAPVTGGRDLAARLAANLIDNAVRHNVRGGWIEVTTCVSSQGCAVLTVANTGPTIPSTEVNRLFRPFQRLDATRVNHVNGHGLGLSIVAAIAKAHDASLDARAPAKGGLEVAVTFPAGAATAAGALRPARDAR